MLLQATVIILKVVTTRTVSNLCENAKAILSFTEAKRRLPGTTELEAMFRSKII